MIVRGIEGKDIKIIEELNKVQGDFKLNGLANCIIDRIVYEGEEIIAYGIVKKLAEAVMLVNPKVPAVTRAKAMRELMTYAEVGAKREKCEQLHCFVANRKLAETLVRKFRFREVQDICLVKNL